jgi:hypothetical protein
MYKMCLFWLLSSIAVAQVPTLSGKEVTGQPQLSALLNWTSIPNATYTVYRAWDGYYGARCPASTDKSWKEMASGLSVATYTDTPTELGSWCYAITATVSDTEGAQSNSVEVVLGNHWYFYVHDRTPNCKRKMKTRPQVSLTFTQVLNNVTTSLPVGRLHPNAFTGIFRLYDNAQYSMQLTLPDGTVINIPNPIFGTGQPLSAVQGSYIVVGFKQGSDTWCDYEEYNYYQSATNN